MTYLLDTCLISELVAKHPNQKVLDWLDAQLPETLYISVITIGEIAKSISKIIVSKRKESLTKWLNETLPSRFKAFAVLSVLTEFEPAQRSRLHKNECATRFSSMTKGKDRREPLSDASQWPKRKDSQNMRWSKRQTTSIQMHND